MVQNTYFTVEKGINEAAYISVDTRGETIRRRGKEGKGRGEEILSQGKER